MMEAMNFVESRINSNLTKNKKGVYVFHGKSGIIKAIIVVEGTT